MFQVLNTRPHDYIMVSDIFCINSHRIISTLTDPYRFEGGLRRKIEKKINTTKPTEAVLMSRGRHHCLAAGGKRRVGWLRD